MSVTVFADHRVEDWKAGNDDWIYIYMTKINNVIAENET